MSVELAKLNSNECIQIMEGIAPHNENGEGSFIVRGTPGQLLLYEYAQFCLNNESIKNRFNYICNLRFGDVMKMKAVVDVMQI